LLLLESLTIVMHSLERLRMLFSGLLDEWIGFPQWSRPGKVLFAVLVSPLVVVHALLAVEVYGHAFPLQHVGAVVALHFALG